MSSGQTRTRDKRTLLFVLPRTKEFGGLEKHLLDLLRRLEDPELSLQVLCFGQDIISNHFDIAMRARVSIRCRKEPESLWGWYRAIRELRPDVIVFCYSWIEAFSWQAPMAALLGGVKRRFAIQHLIPTAPPPPVQGSSPGNVLRRLMGKRARHMLRVSLTGRVSSKTICVSEAVRTALVTDYGFPPRKTITVQNGVSTSWFVPSEREGEAVRSRLAIGTEQFLLVCVARLAEAKGLDILLNAISRVLQRGMSCKCVILGTGPLQEELLRQANSLGLAGNVFFEGFSQDVRPYLQAGSAFILTSYLEGLPLSVLEAMACGLPCIVTKVGGSAEAVIDRVTGLVIPPGSVDAAEEAIAYLATHPDERARMADKARERVCRAFNIESRMNELREVVVG